MDQNELAAHNALAHPVSLTRNALTHNRFTGQTTHSTHGFMFGPNENETAVEPQTATDDGKTTEETTATDDGTTNSAQKDDVADSEEEQNDDDESDESEDHDASDTNALDPHHAGVTLDEANDALDKALVGFQQEARDTERFLDPRFPEPPAPLPGAIRLIGFGGYFLNESAIDYKEDGLVEVDVAALKREAKSGSISSYDVDMVVFLIRKKRVLLYGNGNGWAGAMAEVEKAYLIAKNLESSNAERAIVVHFDLTHWINNSADLFKIGLTSRRLSTWQKRLINKPYEMELASWIWPRAPRETHNRETQ